MGAWEKTVAPGEPLQELLAALPEGAVLCLEPGRYPGRLLLRRSVTLRGLGAPGDVVLDAEEHGTVVTLDAPDVRATIERLTIQGGLSKGGGGGIAWRKPGDLVLRDVVLRECAAPTYGGGGIEASLGTVLLERCRVEDNRSPLGAGIFAHTWVKLTLRDSFVVGNSGKRAAGVLVRDGAEVVIERSTLARNTGHWALRVERDQETVPSVRVSRSIVAGEEGALGNDEGDVTVIDSVVHGEAEEFTDGGGTSREDPELGDDHLPRAAAAAEMGAR